MEFAYFYALLVELFSLNLQKKTPQATMELTHSLPLLLPKNPIFYNNQCLHPETVKHSFLFLFIGDRQS